MKFEHDFAEGTTLRNQARYGRSTRNSIATPPRFNSNDTTEVNRELRAWSTLDKVWDNQTDIRLALQYRQAREPRGPRAR